MKFNKIKLKYIAKLNPPKSEINIIYDDKKDVSFLPMDKILGPNELDLSINKNIEEVYSGYTYFKENDIILAKVTPCFENGNIAIAKNLTNGVGFGTTELHVIRVNQNLYDNKFIYYCLQTEEFKSEAVSNMYGVGGLKRVPIEFLKEYKFLVPELEIQNKISRYLDCKINQINNLIKSKKRLIKLLEQQRQAIITEAVTKGLNPNVKMKDSGVEWIGEIPEHWQLIKSKYIFKEVSKKGFPDKKLLSVSKGKGLIPRDEMENKVVMAFKDLENFKLVTPGDFVIHLRSFQSGFELSEIEGIVSPAYTVFSLRIEGNQRYYKYVFYSKLFIDAIASTTQSLRDGKPIAYADFSNMLMMVPPINEQNEMANYIDLKLLEIDKLIKLNKTAIEKLKEYRQSLIYEAVTGKIDLRDMELD